ncbi:hypothetical protein CJU20_09835 [Pseudomonas aeruginosa]|uniref:hypothetical protein n=1 Tax=Pseudomonas aeruginosa TaxID=287 RepID=UPI000BB89A1F|nr:hypothetical protein [Pseudomonas aeruginosa]PBW00950.1 hypothetical protein CJU20_09835 [Pseudomonas aeruginosa]
MSKFKAGDMALIIYSTAEENVGKVVELIEYAGERSIAGDDGSFIPEGHPRWLVRSASGEKDLAVRTVFGLDGPVIRKIFVSQGYCRQSWLMPLRGGFQPEQQKAKGVEA